MSDERREQERARMARRMLEEARLIILRELHAQGDDRITSSSMRNHLDEVWGIYRDREWVEQQFAWLKEMGAITVLEAGSVKIAALTENGKAHLRIRRTIPGILVPSEPVV